MPNSNPIAISDPFIPNGVTTEFPFTFRVVASDQLAVIDQDEVVLSSSLYSVALSGEGGTVTFSVAPALADYDTLRILSVPDFKQAANFDNGGPSFNPAAVTKAIDDAAARDVAQNEKLDRALVSARGEDVLELGAVGEGQVPVRSGNKLIGADSDIGSTATILAAAAAVGLSVTAAAGHATEAENSADEVADTLAGLTATQFSDPAAASGAATGSTFACAQEYGVGHDLFAKTATGETFTKSIAIDAAAVSLKNIERDWLRDHPLPAGVHHYNAANLALNDRRGVPTSTAGAMSLDRILIADAINPRNESGSENNPDTVGRDTDVLAPDGTSFATTANFDSTTDQLYIGNGASIPDTALLVDDILVGGFLKVVSGDLVDYRVGCSSNVNGTDSNPAYSDTTATNDWQDLNTAKYVGRDADTGTGFSIRVATGESITASEAAVVLWAKDRWGGEDKPSYAKLKTWHDLYPAKAPWASRGAATVNGPYFETSADCLTMVVSLNKQVDFSAGYTFYSTLKTTSDSGASASAAQAAVSFARQRGTANLDKNQDAFGLIGAYAINGNMYAKPILSSIVSGIVAKVGDRGDIFLAMTAEPLATEPTKAKYTIFVNGVLSGIFKDDWDEPDAELLALGSNDLGKNRNVGGADNTIDYGAQFGWAARALTDDEIVGIAKGADAYLKAHGNAGLNISYCWVKGADSTRAFDESPDWYMQDLRPIGEIDVMEARGGSAFEVSNVSSDVTDFASDQYNDKWREDFRNRCGATALKMGYTWVYIGVGSVNDLVPSRSLADGGHFATWEEGRTAIFAYAAADRLRIIALAQEGDHAITEAEATAQMLYLSQTISSRADYFGGTQEPIQTTFNTDLTDNGFAEANGLDGYFDRESYVPAGFASKDDAIEDAHLNGDNVHFLQGNGGVHWADQSGIAASQQYEFDEERRVIGRHG